MKDSFERYGVVSIVDDINDADAVLKARIVKIARHTRTSSSNTDSALQQDEVLSVAGELRRVTGAVLWRDTDVSSTKTFGQTGSVVLTTSPDFAGGTLSASDLNSLNSRELSRGQEQEALQALVDDVSNKIYDEAVAPDF